MRFNVNDTVREGVGEVGEDDGGHHAVVLVQTKYYKMISRIFKQLFAYFCKLTIFFMLL